MDASISRTYDINLSLRESELYDLLLELKHFVIDNQNYDNEVDNEMLAVLYNELNNAIERSKGTELI